MLIDTGGRQDNPASLVQSDRVLAHADLPEAGRTGRSLEGFVTVTSAVPRRVQVSVQERYVSLDWRDELNVEVRDAGGGLLASVRPRAVIDGAGADGDFGQIWARFERRLPEVHLRGTWEQIGRQMAEQKLITAHDPGRGAEERLALYEKKFPYYASLLQGAAEQLQTDPLRLVQSDRTPGTVEAVRDACMGLLINGPDGPLHLYSKERSNSSLHGMGYVKVTPNRGYRYHMYTLNHVSYGYGVNEAGLSTSGASINCDARTEQVAAKETARRRESGKTHAPLGMHMLLAMCADVDEAVRFLNDADAPLGFTGNMLIADRKGQAVVLESVGTYYQIVPMTGKDLPATGNYPHRRSDGLFEIGTNWGWAANTMLRETYVASLLKQRGGRATLDDAFTLMASRAETGGMCQYRFENPGLLYSTCSSIAVLRGGDLYITHGPPNQVEYVRYRLDDPPASESRPKDR